MDRDGIYPLGLVSACVVPVAVLMTTLVVLNHGYDGLMDTSPLWEKQRKLWGGNPSEVFSHWLDLVVMSGNAMGLAWLLVVEARILANWPRHPWLMRLKRCVVGIGLGASALTALVLDISKGEGTMVLVLPVLFIPLLGATYYLLRQWARLLNWRFLPVVGMAVLFACGHVTAQMFYEPSETGGPNQGMMPLWIGSVFLAVGWAMARGFLTGSIPRWFCMTWRTVRKPRVFLPILFLLLLIISPATWRAWSYRHPREQEATRWLAELETRLTDDCVIHLIRQHDLPDDGGRIELSEDVLALFADPRIEEGDSIRLFVPVDENEFLLLWANKEFTYGDIRPLRSDHGGEQMDQRFIDALLERGNFHQTGMWSALFSRHLAGDVFKDQRGMMKAFAVIESRP
jgi:hypothetical protein